MAQGFRTVGERISENQVKENGFLKCFNVRIARTGPQMYLGASIGIPNDMSEWIVERHPEDVFNEKFMLSLEDKPITLEHPPVDVTIDNADQYLKGYIRDVRKGRDEELAKNLTDIFHDSEGHNTLYANLYVTNKEVAELIENKEYREVSVGYDCRYEFPYIGKNIAKQIPLYANHLAVVKKGRALTAKIRDSEDKERVYESVVIELEGKEIEFENFTDADIDEYLKEF